MIATSYTDFRTGLKRYLDKVDDNNETLIIHRGREKSSVVISLKEYNSIMETMHLLKSRKNAEWLYESIEQVKRGEIVSEPLIEE